MTIVPLGQRAGLCCCLLAALTGIVRADDFKGKVVTAIQYDPPAQPLDSRDLERMQLVQ